MAAHLPNRLPTMKLTGRTVHRQDSVPTGLLLPELRSYLERPGRKLSELPVESFFLQAYRTSKQRDISETIDFFFYIAYRTKKIFRLSI